MQRRSARRAAAGDNPNLANTLPGICSTIGNELAALWDPARDGSGGYGDTPTLAAPPSLYYTAWTIRLADAAHLDLPFLDRNAVAEAVVASATSSNPVDDDARIPPAERLYLAVETLRILDVPIPGTVIESIASLRAGQQYRSDRTAAEPDWPATYLAVQALAQTGQPVPSEVNSLARTQELTAKAAADPQTIMSFGIPVLGTLSATPGLLAATEPDLAAVLSNYTTTLLREGGASAVTAAGLASIKDIAAAAGILPPTMPMNFLTLLPTGYYSIGEGQQHGDPQATFYAVRLGAKLTESAKAALSTGQVRQGWLSTLSKPTLTSSYQAAITAKACGIAVREPDKFKTLISKWLLEAGEQGNEMRRSVGAVMVPGDGQGGSASTAGKACWLAQV